MEEDEEGEGKKTCGKHEDEEENDEMKTKQKVKLYGSRTNLLHHIKGQRCQHNNI